MRENTASVMISGDESLLLTLSVDDEFAEKLMWGLLGGKRVLTMSDQPMKIRWEST